MNEDQNLEFKSTLTNKLKREIVSFLNTDGGTIYLGVDDLTKKSLPISESQKHEWEEILNHWYTNAFYPTPFNLIDILPNEKIFTIKIKSGPHKPYAIASQGFDSSGVYVRYGSSAVKATNEQIKRMLQQNNDNNLFDDEPAKNQDLSFEKLKKQAQTKNVTFNIRALHLLQSPNIYNNTAFLVSDQNTVTSKVAIFQGTDVMIFKDKREISGPITTQIDELLYFIDLNNHTRIEITGKPQHHEIKDFPNEAIREALVNAFTHRDYLLHSPIKVEIFDDRIEILSSGGIPDGLTLADIKGGMTAARNLHLIHVLDKLNYIENYGTGISRIYAAYKETDQQPHFEVYPNSFKVILPNINWHSAQNNATSFHFINNEQAVLSFLADSGRSTRKDIQLKLGTGPYQTRRILRKLIGKGKIKQTGHFVNPEYEIS